MISSLHCFRTLCICQTSWGRLGRSSLTVISRCPPIRAIYFWSLLLDDDGGDHEDQVILSSNHHGFFHGRGRSGVYLGSGLFI